MPAIPRREICAERGDRSSQLSPGTRNLLARGSGQPKLVVRGDRPRGGNSGGDEIRGDESIQNGALSAGSSRWGLARIVGGVATPKRYALMLTASFRNLLNNVKPALPIDNLSSPVFGKSIALSPSVHSPVWARTRALETATFSCS